MLRNARQTFKASSGGSVARHEGSMAEPNMLKTSLHFDMRLAGTQVNLLTACPNAQNIFFISLAQRTKAARIVIVTFFPA